MANITQQPPAPLPVHSTILPPPPKSHSDMFLDMIQGKSVTIVVGQNSLYYTYTLPVALLCVHSLYFRNQIVRFNTNSKKRKLSPPNESEEVEAKAAVETKEKNEEPNEKESAKEDINNEERIIRLSDVDPAIFGLFLKFIYKDSYPSNVDARILTAQNHHRSLAAVQKPTTPGPASSAASSQPSSNVSSASSNGYSRATPPPSHMPTLMPPPPPPQGFSQIEYIPPSVHAWLLAQRLGTLSFMNHAISRIFSGIGFHFALTPSLMDYVWKETSPQPSPSSPSSVTSSPNNSSSSTTLTPSPLRKLFLDVLVSYWSHSRSPNPNAVILRSLSASSNLSTPLKEAWDRLFNEHTDLRNAFIYGLQDGVNKLMPVAAYFATPAPTGGSGVVKGGVAGSEFGKEHGRGGGQVEKEAAVKEEKNDETNIPASEKESGI